MRLFILSCLAALVCTTGMAQTRTDYYPNGNKRFEGQYSYTWPSTEGGAPDIMCISDGTPITAAADVIQIAPLKTLRRYEGRCLFYTPEGTLALEGHFRAGLREGEFTYYRPNGSIERKRTYHNDMADGRWEVKDSSGNLVSIETYKAYSPEMLDSFYRDAAAERSYRADPGYNVSGRMHVTDQMERYNTRFLGKYIASIELAVKHFAYTSMWDGDFTVAGFGPDPHIIWLKMHFTENLPTGNWQLIDDEGKVACTFDFTNGKLIGGSSYGKTFQELSDSAAHSQYIDRASPAVFRYVELMPKAAYDVPAFIAKNLHRPEGAGAIDTIYVQCIVNETGSLTDATVIRKHPAGYNDLALKAIEGSLTSKEAAQRDLLAACEAEAMRVVLQLPSWLPGKQNGMPVKMYYNIPVVFGQPKQ